MIIRERLISVINTVVEDAQCIGAEEIADAIIDAGLIQEHKMLNSDKNAQASVARKSASNSNAD